MDNLEMAYHNCFTDMVSFNKAHKSEQECQGFERSEDICAVCVHCPYYTSKEEIAAHFNAIHSDLGRLQIISDRLSVLKDCVDNLIKDLQTKTYGNVVVHDWNRLEGAILGLHSIVKGRNK